jgi:hypothetical protein
MVREAQRAFRKRQMEGKKKYQKPYIMHQTVDLITQTSSTKLMIDFLLPSPLSKHRSQKEIGI